MALLEILLKPLLDAQREVGFEIGYAEGYERGYAEGYERGYARGYAEATAKFEVWKERQRAAGARFVEFDYDSIIKPSASDC